MLVISPGYTIIVILHPEESLKYLGYMESVSNIGTGLGPIIGSVLYDLIGYFYMFLTMSFFLAIFIPLIMIFKTVNFDQNDETTNLSEKFESSQEFTTKISFVNLI